MRVICASTMKGGAGKTATTCWIANVLAKHSDQKVLVIDADNQKSITDLRQEDKEIAESGGGGVSFDWDLKTASPEEAQAIIEEAYEKESYDLIFIDMPRMTGLEDDAIIALLAMCDSFIIPIKPARADALATGHFMATMAELKKIRQDEGYPTYVYAFHNFYRNIKENTYLPEFAEEIGIQLFQSKIKLKKIYENYNTYTSLLESQEGRDEFLPFINEFLEKYEIEADLIIPTTK